MNLSEANKPKITNTVVIYGGRFQPFHRGHYDAYQRLCSKFGSSSVYIGTSNDTSGGKSPFTFKEKKEIATKMFGIPSSHFVKVNNPYRPTEILKKFDGKTTKYIAAVGDKDADRLKGKYFKPYTNKEGYGYDEIGYVYPVPPEPNPISGTDVRKGLGNDDKEKAKKFFLKAYPKFDKDIFNMIKNKLNEDGFPGGIGTGLNLPGGYINGAPTGSTSELFDPIIDIVSQVITEDEFVNFVKEYFDKIENESNNGEQDRDVTYTNTKGEPKKIKVKDALRLPKEHPAHIQASKIIGPADAPINEPKKKIDAPQSGQPVQQGQTAQGKIDNTSNTQTIPTDNTETQTELPNPQKLSGVELKTAAEIKLEKENTNNSQNPIVSRISSKLQNLSKQQKQFFLNKLNKNTDLTPQKFERIIDSYNNKKLNENITPSKVSSINNFIGFATKRLKLKETPKVTLLTGPEYAQQKSSLGGYNPMTKEIFVVTDNRLTADILRTLAHEMVHRKQDELGLVRNEIKDGADGSPIENQAHAVAGILMREYGRINKKIYTEDINIDVDKGDTVLMGKFKNKKVVVKDFGKDDHGMPTINGKVATTFRLGQKGQNIFDKDENINEMGSKDIHFKNIVKYYDKGSSNVKKQVGLIVCGNKYARRDRIVGELRDMGYNEITAIEKELGIENFDESMERLYSDIDEFISNYFDETITEVSGLSGEDSQSDGAYIPKGKVRKLGGNDGVNKSDDWFVNGGYTQTQFPKADAIYGDDDANQLTVSYSAKNLPRSNDNISTDFPVRKPIKKLLHEGGAYGHMSHPFDDMELTFGDLKTIISSALEGELGVVREKTDGQALAISWKNGRLIAARNKSNLANAGADAMGIEDVASKFAGRGGLTDAYNFAMKDLSSAISGLSEAQRKKIFNEGKCFMNLEVIWPESVNVIPYGQALLIFHNTVCYNEAGNAIGADNGAASTLAGMIKQINADIQSRYVIQGPPITSIPKSTYLSSKQGKYVSKLNKLQSQFGLKDSDNVSDYHQAWWESFINKSSPIKVDKLTKDALIRRWAFGDKSFRLNTISNPKIQKWAVDNDKVNVAKQQKDNIRPFEEIFLGVGADVLEFVGSVLTVYPDKAIRSMKDRLKSVAAQVRNGGDPTKISKLKSELTRLNSLGGVDRIVASEGLVFFYNGKTYKLTGTFAPLNQILGIFYS